MFPKRSPHPVKNSVFPSAETQSTSWFTSSRARISHEVRRERLKPFEPDFWRRFDRSVSYLRKHGLVVGFARIPHEEMEES